MKRVVITGIGIISSIGNNQQEVLESLKTGRSGISFSEEFKKIGLRSHVCGDIKLSKNDIKQNINRKFLRFMSDCSIYTYLSMNQAIQDAKLTEDQVSNIQTGLIVGSSSNSPHHQVSSSNNMRSKGLHSVSPYIITKVMASSISACLGISFKIKGINYSISSACSSSAHCIGNAVELIQLGKQNIIFAGGGEELSWELTCEFDAIGALSTKYNITPEKASRTYDQNRDGFVIAAGGGIIVIEELNNALTRGAYIYAEIIGYGATSNGYGMVIPSGDGAERCMKIALLNTKYVDYINTHGTSTISGDIKELEAIAKVFKNNIPAISSTKSITGHSLGASGIHEIIYSLLMLKYQFIAPSINIDNLDKKAYLMNIITKPINKKLNTIMSNSFGFGGTNVSLIISKYH